MINRSNQDRPCTTFRTSYFKLTFVLFMAYIEVFAKWDHDWLGFYLCINQCIGLLVIMMIW